MQITATFENIQEMQDFARLMMGRTDAIESAPSEAAAKDMQVPVLRPQVSVQYQAPVNQAPPQYQAPVNQTPAQPTIQQPAPTPSIQQPVQTSSISYSEDDLAKAAMALMDAGRQAELVNLLRQFGVDSLPNLSPEQYGGFATALRGMGAQI